MSAGVRCELCLSAGSVALLAAVSPAPRAPAASADHPDAVNADALASLPGRELLGDADAANAATAAQYAWVACHGEEDVSVPIDRGHNHLARALARPDSRLYCDLCQTSYSLDPD